MQSIPIREYVRISTRIDQWDLEDQINPVADEIQYVARHVLRWSVSVSSIMININMLTGERLCDACPLPLLASRGQPPYNRRVKPGFGSRI